MGTGCLVVFLMSASLERKALEDSQVLRFSSCVIPHGVGGVSSAQLGSKMDESRA